MKRVWTSSGRRAAMAFSWAAVLLTSAQAFGVEEGPVQTFASKHPECLAWSDGCVICARDERAKTHCSTPGIACLPAPIVCKVSKTSP